MTRLLPTTLSLLIATLILALSSHADDWPFFRGPNRDGISAETGWKTAWPEAGPSIAWEAEAGVGCASIVTTGDRVVTMGNREDEDNVTCFHADDGRVLWTHTYACEFEKRMFEGGTAATPTIHDDKVYTVAYDGQVHCLDLESGEPVWTTHLVHDHDGRPPRWKYASSPLVIGPLVILDTGADGGSTLALDKDSGEKKWATGKDEAGYATPMPYRLDGDPAVAVFKAEHMVGYDLKGGRELWRIPWETDYNVNASTPTWIDDSFVISSGYKTGRTARYRFPSNKPTEMWKNEELKTKMSSVVVFKDHVYGITEKKARLMCLRLSDGSVAWETRGFTQYGTLLIAGDHIIALTEDGELVVVEADGSAFTEVARASVLDGRCWVNPILANGRIYAKNNDGHLVCLDVR